mmetsp:Transcript_103492/g.259429  ORF Transcript_103492/g.259429 Transcript_103492/m.259429 type:complete len:219 (-) Transcript_103492:15-671(-)
MLVLVLSAVTVVLVTGRTVLLSPSPLASSEPTLADVDVSVCSVTIVVELMAVVVVVLERRFGVTLGIRAWPGLLPEEALGGTSAAGASVEGPVPGATAASGASALAFEDEFDVLPFGGVKLLPSSSSMEPPARTPPPSPSQPASSTETAAQSSAEATRGSQREEEDGCRGAAAASRRRAPAGLDRRDEEGHAAATFPDIASSRAKDIALSRDCSYSMQ